jgi:hypothetical protein
MEILPEAFKGAQDPPVVVTEYVKELVGVPEMVKVPPEGLLTKELVAPAETGEKVTFAPVAPVIL